MPSVGKAFVVGPAYAPILGKLLAKITSGAFVELAKPHTYLDGKLLIAPAKKRVVEITDILTWIQAFTIYQWIFCSTYPSRWQDTTQYKLLILQTASQFPGPAWLNYDTAFRKDAAASLLADWSKMNLDLYNFHIRASGTVTGQSASHSTSLPHTSASSNVPPKRSFDPIQYCRSWNDGACRWSLGQCRYRHVCERCDGQHPLTNCPFRAYKGFQRSSVPDPSLHPGENAVGVNNKVAFQVAASSCVNSVNSSLIVPRSTFAFIGVDSQQKIGLPQIFRVFNDSCPSAPAPSLHQLLLPPYKVSPIRVDKLRQEVLTHPDQSFVTYVLDGLQNGFRVGFNPASVSLKSATQNMPSASLQPSVIDDYLYTELAKGRVAGPFSSPPLPHLHISRFGVIPKKHQPGKWRLILDLSSPDGHSVNDGIRKDPFTVQYMKVDDIIDGIMSLGRGTLLAKFDVESAYRIIPVHPNDLYLLGMQWQGNYFVDITLPFGLPSAP